MASLGKLGTVSVDIRACLDGLNDDLKAGAKAITTSLENASKRLNGIGQRLTDSISKPLLKAGLDAIHASSDAAEMQSKFKTVFGDAADDVAQWAAEQASAFNRSKFDLQSYLATLQDTFKPLGFAAEQATEMSKAVTILAEDLASFQNLETGDVLRSLTSALVGNTESVRKFAVVINQERLDEKLRQMGVSGVAAASEQQKAFARLQLIIESTTDAQGDALRTSSEYANQLRGLKASFNDLAVEIGQILLPFAQDLVVWLRDSIEWFKNLDPAVKEIGLIVAATFAVGGPVLLALGAFITAAAAIGATGGAVLVALAAGAAAFIAFKDDAATAFSDLSDLIGISVDAIGETIDSMLGPIKELAGGLKTWLVDKPRAMFDGLIERVEDASDAFGDMSDDVVMNSYVPDMISRVGDEFGKLDAVMVKPSLAATAEVSTAFAGMAEEVGAEIDSTRVELSNVADEIESVGEVVKGNLTSALRGNIEGWEDLKDAALDAIQNIILDLAELESVQTSVGNFFGSLFGSIFGSGTTASSVIRTDAAGRVLGGIAGGGLIRGPGTGTSDSILARLSNGEFVVNARAAQAHLPLLEAINAGGLRAFAAGGLALPRVATPNLPQMIEAPREGPAGDPGAGAGFHVHFDRMTKEEIGRSLPQVRRAALGFLAKGGAR